MKIGMIVAMTDEVGALLKKIGTPLRQEDCCGLTVRIYAMGGHELYVIKSGVGEIYAAGATQLLISKYSVQLIVNFGICGGLTPDMGLKRAAVVESVVHYDFDTSAVDNEGPAKYPDYPGIYIPAPAEVVDAALSAAPSLERVICASADKFVGDPEQKRELNRLYGAKICEMEAAGILLTANRANVPALIVKAVSDSVTAGADEFSAMVSEAAESCVTAMMAALRGLC